MTAGNLSVRELGSTTPGGKVLLHPLSIEVPAAQRLAVVGPNGAGKSTLLKLLAGRLAPTLGRVEIDGANLAGLTAEARAQRIAVLAQSEPAGLTLRVCEYVALGRIPWRRQHAATTHRHQVAQALALCGLERLGERSFDTLSGGERQRAALARTLAQAPSVLLLDEPTNHLDLRARFDLLDLIRGLGITVVAVLHDLALLERFADRVAVIDGGRLVATGPPTAALSRELVQRVFRVEAVRLPHPGDGRPLWVFDGGAVHTPAMP